MGREQRGARGAAPAPGQAHTAACGYNHTEHKHDDTLSTAATAHPCSGCTAWPGSGRGFGAAASAKPACSHSSSLWQ